MGPRPLNVEPGWFRLVLCGPFQALQPHVRVWDSVSLSTLQVIGLGTFERGVGSLAFSKAVSVHQEVAMMHILVL